MNTEHQSFLGEWQTVYFRIDKRGESDMVEEKLSVKTASKANPRLLKGVIRRPNAEKMVIEGVVDDFNIWRGEFPTAEDPDGHFALMVENGNLVGSYELGPWSKTQATNLCGTKIKRHKRAKVYQFPERLVA